MIKRFLFTLACIIFTTNLAQATTRALTIYTTHSFASQWSKDGNSIKNSFERQCNCSINFVTFEGGASLLSRLQLEENNSNADLVIGFNMNQMAHAASLGYFAPHNINLSQINLPIQWEDRVFLPYEYGYLAFNYNEKILKNPPHSMQELIGRNDFKIIIEDPRSSTLGLGMLTWMKKIYGDDTAAKWAELSKKIITIPKSWSEAYGLFLKNEADMVLSYTTSPIYHITKENDPNFKAAIFDEGHYLEIYVMAKLKNAKQNDLADDFLKFASGETFQNYIPLNNFMYPSIKLSDKLPKIYQDLPTPTQSYHYPPEVVFQNKKQWINEWLNALSKN